MPANGLISSPIVLVVARNDCLDLACLRLEVEFLTDGGFCDRLGCESMLFSFDDE